MGGICPISNSQHTPRLSHRHQVLSCCVPVSAGDRGGVRAAVSRPHSTNPVAPLQCARPATAAAVPRPRLVVHPGHLAPVVGVHVGRRVGAVVVPPAPEFAQRLFLRRDTKKNLKLILRITNNAKFYIRNECYLQKRG